MLRGRALCTACATRSPCIHRSRRCHVIIRWQSQRRRSPNRPKLDSPKPRFKPTTITAARTIAAAALPPPVGATRFKAARLLKSPDRNSKPVTKHSTSVNRYLRTRLRPRSSSQLAPKTVRTRNLLAHSLWMARRAACPPPMVIAIVRCNLGAHATLTGTCKWVQNHRGENDALQPHRDLCRSARSLHRICHDFRLGSRYVHDPQHRPVQGAMLC